MCRHFINKCGNSAAAAACNMSCQCCGSTQPWGHNQWAGAALQSSAAAYLQLQHVVELLPLPQPFPPVTLFSPPVCICNQSGSNADCCSMWHALEIRFNYMQNAANKIVLWHSDMFPVSCSFLRLLSPLTRHSLTLHNRTNRVNNEWFALGQNTLVLPLSACLITHKLIIFLSASTCI